MSGKPQNLDDARLEVQAILASGIFTPASRQARLLEYLFAKVSQGQSENLKEYTIAVELFHKPEDFDQHSDATVRVEAHRLRKKLEKFYEKEGASHALRVVLPLGHYSLEFLPASTSFPPQQGIRHPRKMGDDFPSRWPGKIASIRSTRLRWLLAGIFGVLIISTAYLAYKGREPGSITPPQDISPSAHSPDEMPDPEPDALRILAGHVGEDYVDVSGRRWKSDRFFEGGAIRTLNREILSRTGRPRLFQKAREGNFQYQIPLPAGEYELRLYFADPDNPTSEKNPERRWRIFAIQSNGNTVLRAIDLPAETGFNADIRCFSHLKPTPSGFLTLGFYSARGPAIVNAIELLPMRGGKVRPVRIYTGPQLFLDFNDVYWSPDDFYAGGKISPYPAMIASQEVDPGVLSYERYGAFEYFIPVAEGEYQAKLFFAETWFGPKNTGGGGVGSRLFDVLLNNKPVLENFDLLREAPPNQLIQKTFRHVRPDQQGKLHFSFASQVNHAMLRAIEVLPE